MARDPEYYKSVGPMISQDTSPEMFQKLAREFVEKLQTAPPPGRLLNALQHMWGYVSPFKDIKPDPTDLRKFLAEIVRLSIQHNIEYLVHSTALSELALFV